MNNKEEKKILLALLPFWSPLIPPMGISCLQEFLRGQGYQVKSLDANTVAGFRETYNIYFETLKECIPENKRKNFYNIGHDLLQNHMMGHLNYKNEKEYIEMVRVLIKNNFLYLVDTEDIQRLNSVIKGFFKDFKDYFLQQLESEQPTVLGLSVFRGNLPASLFACKLTRDRYPHIQTVMGGGIFSQELDVNSENLLYFAENTPFIDKILIGEGEILFQKFLKGELPQNKKVCTLEDIDNQTLDFSLQKPPEYLDFNLLQYPNLPAYSSRSCPFQCSFCSETIYWGKFRKKAPKQVVEEMIGLFEKFRRQSFLMCDSLLNPIISDLAREIIDSGISLYWDGYLRADKHACDEENTILWRRGGFYRARLGLESGAPKVLQMMGKKITPAQMKEVISNLAEAGIKTTTYWVVGHPGETREDFQQTLDFVEELRDDVYEAECNPFRYFETGQVNSSEWADNTKVPLYPGVSRDLLMVQSWGLPGEPGREETLLRVEQFVNHCKKLGIPNPYSLQEIYYADERWKNLHANSVPSLMDLNDNNIYIDESQFNN
jgi:hypothetical protein